MRKTPKAFLPLLVLFLLITQQALAQLLITSVSISNDMISQVAQYNFQIVRYGTVTPVPAGTVIEISFPNAYASSGVSGCVPYGWGTVTSLACTYSQLKLLVSGGFPASSTMENFGILASGIKNPDAAKVYSQFSVRFLLPDNTVQTGLGGYSVTITTANATCSLTLVSGLVFGQGLLTINYQSQYITNTSIGYTMKLSMLQSYPSDPSNTDINPILSISSTMSAPYLFEFSFTNSFNISMLMPPSTQPEVNFIFIMTSNILGDYDKCYLTISGVQPNQFSALTLKQAEVQSLSTLEISMLAYTPILTTDLIRIDFGTSEFGLSQVSGYATFTNGVVGQRQVTKAGQILTIKNIAAFVIVSQLGFTLSGIGFPYSTKPQSITIFIETDNGYIRNSETYSYTSKPGTLQSPAYTCLTSQIGYTTSCTLSLRLKNEIKSTSYLELKYPTGFRMTNGFAQCSTSGTNLNTISGCTSYGITNTIRVTGMVQDGVAAVAGGTAIEIVIPGVNLPTKPDTYSLTIFSKTAEDYVIDTTTISFTVVPRALLTGQISITSSSTTTSSITDYTLTLSLPISLGIPYTLSLYIPFPTYSTPSVNNNLLSSTYNPTTQILIIDSIGSTSLVLSGFLTHESTQPITLSGNLTSTNVLYFYFRGYDVSMLLPREVSVFDVSQSNVVVGRICRADMIVSDLKVGDVVKIPAEYYALTQADCSSNCVCGSNGNVVVNAVNNYQGTLTKISVNLMNNKYISVSTFNITILTPDSIFLKQTKSISLTTQLTNTLSITATQSNPYYTEASVYTFTVTMTTTPPTTSVNNLLQVSIPSQYAIQEWACVYGCTAPQPPPIGGVLYFGLLSTVVGFTVKMVNPVAFLSAIQMTSSSFGDMDYGVYLPAVPCAAPCRSCSTANTSQCLTCYLWKSQNKLRNGTCVSECPSGEFYNNASFSCQACHSYCLSCVNTSTTCYTCKPQYFYFQLSCLQDCPTSYYPTSTGECGACSTDCLACTSATNCTLCRSTTFLYLQACWASCRPGTYVNPLVNQCVNCSGNCVACDETGCSQCQNNYYLYNKQCYLQCPAGLFKSVSTCEPCQSPCLTCSTFSNNCTSCITRINTTLYYYLTNRCYATSCPDTYYISPINNECLACQSPCLTCNRSQCLTCVTGMYFYNGFCSSECIVGTYPTGNMTCIACTSPCASCTTESSCLSCTAPYFLYNSTCILVCPDGFYQELSVCKRCESPCLTCTSASICKSCLSLSFFNGSCFSSCPLGYYSGTTTVLNQTAKQCKTCISPCTTCLSPTLCLSCNNGLKLYNQACQSTCPSQYYDQNNICFACSFPCKNCNASGCLTCAGSGLYLQRQECLANCTDLFANNVTMQCEACRFPCSTCTWSDTCLSCQDPYIFQAGQCVRTCPSGKYASNRACLDCPSLCSTCNLQSDQIRCPTCKPGNYFYGYDCVSQCPNTTTLENPYCLSPNCDSLTDCLTCSNLRCLECSTNFTLNSTTGKCQLIPVESSVISAVSQIPVPFPFLIATIVIIICAFLIRIEFNKMFAPLFIYGFVGVAEAGVIALWLALIYTKGVNDNNTGFILKIAASVVAGIYVFFNLLGFILYLKITRSDSKFRTWQKQDNKCASVIVAIIALIITFRFSVLKYSKLGHLQKFSATLSHDSKLSHENVMSFFSIVFISIPAVVISAWIAYLQIKMNYLFFTSLQVAAVSVIMIILSIVQSLSPKGYTMEKKQEYKQGHDSDGIDGQSLSEMMVKMGVVQQEYHEGKQIMSQEHSVMAQNARNQDQFNEAFKTNGPLIFTKAQDDKLSIESDIQYSMNSEPYSEPVSNQTATLPVKDQKQQLQQLQDILMQAQKRANELNRPSRPIGIIRKQQTLKQLEIEDKSESQEIESDDEPPPIGPVSTGRKNDGPSLRREEGMDLKDLKEAMDIEERRLGMKRLQQLFEQLKQQQRQEKQLRERLQKITTEQRQLKQKEFQRARQAIQRNQMNVEDKISKVQKLMEERNKNQKKRKDKLKQIEQKRKQERAIKIAQQAAKKNLVFPINQQEQNFGSKIPKKIVQREHIQNQWMGSLTKLNFEPTNDWKISQERLSPELKMTQPDIKDKIITQPYKEVELDHWPIDPELEQKIIEVEARANQYIKKPKKSTLVVQEYDMELDSDLGAGTEEILYKEEQRNMSDQSQEQEGEQDHKAIEVDSTIKIPKKRANRSVINLSPNRK